MDFVRVLLIILEAALSLALIGLILLQKSKGEGMGAAFGGGGSDSLLGARAGNVLTKATVWLGGFFLVNTLVLGVLFSGSTDASVMDGAGDADVVPVEQPAGDEIPALPAE